MDRPWTAWWIGLLGALLLPAAGCSLARGWEAALVLSDIAAGTGPSRLKETTPPPRVAEVRLPVAGRSYRGDLYTPPQGAAAAVLLVPGAAEQGKDDPRLVAFATSLARARFTVLVPDLPSLRELRVNPGNVGEIADSFAWLARQPALAPGGRAGMAAFSYAVGPTVLAALRPGTAEAVRFILGVGGYHDLEQVLGFFTTGWFRHEGRWRHQEPNAYGKWVFVQSNLDRVDVSRDRDLLRAMIERKQGDLGAPVDDLAAGLTAGGKDLYAFITNQDREKVAELIAGLPPGVREDLAALTLVDKDLSALRARLILIHGRDDPIIPFPQSVALAGAAPADRVDLYLVDGLAHVDLQPGLGSRLRLWRALYVLLGEREGGGRSAAKKQR